MGSIPLVITAASPHHLVFKLSLPQYYPQHVLVAVTPTAMMAVALFSLTPPLLHPCVPEVHVSHNCFCLRVPAVSPHCYVCCVRPLSLLCQRRELLYVRVLLMLSVYTTLVPVAPGRLYPLTAPSRIPFPTEQSALSDVASAVVLV